MSSPSLIVVKKKKKVKADDDIYTFRRSPPFCFVLFSGHSNAPPLKAGTHVTGQDWVDWFHGARNQLFIHLHHRAHVYSSSPCVVCTTSVVVVVGFSYVRTILLTRGHEFEQRFLKFFRWE